MSTRRLLDDEVSSLPWPVAWRGLQDATTDPVFERGWTYRIAPAAEISFSSVLIHAQLAPDTTAEPGVELSGQILDFVRDRDALRQLATRFTVEGFAGVQAGFASAAAFSLLLNHIPTGGHLPRIAPDEDGALTLQWSFPDKDDLLGLIDGWTLHLVEAPATSYTKYHAPVDLKNGVPPSLTKALSRR